MDATAYKEYATMDSMSKKEPPRSYIIDLQSSTTNNDAATDFTRNSQKRLLNHDDAGIPDPSRKKRVSGFDSACNPKELEPSKGNLVSVDNQATQEVENVVADAKTIQTEWDDVCKKIMNHSEITPHRENLEMFLSGMKQLEAAQTSLQGMYEATLTSLEKILESSLASAVPIHEMDCDIMSNIEMETLGLFRHNHNLRKETLYSLNNFHHAWETKHQDMLSRLFVRADSTASSTEAKCDDDCDDSIGMLPVDTSITGDQDGAVKDAACTDADLNGLNWDELIQMRPNSREHVEAFLNGCDRWNTACNKLSSSFDDIRQKIETHHDSILQIVESAYSRINDDMVEVQDKIKGYIASNFCRRSQIEQSLAEITQRQNNIISRFFARVVGSVPNLWKKT